MTSITINSKINHYSNSVVNKVSMKKWEVETMFSKVMSEYMPILLKKKLLLVIIWGCILALNTWTDNLGDLLRLQSIGFRWISHPNYLSFFDFLDITRIHHNFVIVKTGHFIGFAIFDFLLFNWKKDHKVAIVTSVIFALTTEILQLFMGRDGRLYDLIIDSLGVITVYFILKYNLMNKLYKQYISK